MDDAPIPHAPSAALVCPLPTVHREWSDEADDYVIVTRPCEEDLGVKHRGWDPIFTDGIYESGDWWQIECLAGHVLVVPFSDGDPPPEISEVREAVAAALLALGVTDVDPHLDPDACHACNGPMMFDVDTERRYCNTTSCPEYGVQLGGSSAS